MPLTLEEIRGLFIALWPPGDLYDWHTPGADVGRYIDGCAEALKTFGYDLVDRLRLETNPLTCTQKVPDWELALGLLASFASLKGTIDQRRAGVVGKLREFGAFTLANVRAILGPILGYAEPDQLVVYETSRAAMKNAHTYVDNGRFGAPAAGSVTRTICVPDGGLLGGTGAQVAIRLSHPALEEIQFALIAPAGKVKRWIAVASGPANPLVPLVLYAPELAGTQCNVEWRFTITNTGSTVAKIVGWSLFVEGYGTGGLGGELSDWGVFADPALLGSSGVAPDFNGASHALTRVEHAHTLGHILRSISAIPDNPLTIPDAVIPG